MIRTDAKGMSGACWIEKSGAPTDLTDAIARTANCSPLLAKLLALRGITPPEVAGFLSPGFADIKPPESFPAIARAVDLICDAAERRQLIAIYGDYDVDGITSIAILSKILSPGQFERNARTTQVCDRRIGPHLRMHGHVRGRRLAG